MSEGSGRLAAAAIAAALVAIVAAWQWSRVHTEVKPPPAASDAAKPAPDAPLSAVPPSGRPPGDAPAASAATAPNSAAAVSAQPPAASIAGVAPNPATPGAEAGAAPSFDVVRIEPTGDSVIAGRAAPGAAVELLRNGEPLARVVADATGLFAIVPPPLPPGTHEIVLQSTGPGGALLRSAQSVTAVIAPARNEAPLVTVTAPDRPTIVLSRPDAPVVASNAPAASTSAPPAAVGSPTSTPAASSPGSPSSPGASSPSAAASNPGAATSSPAASPRPSGAPAATALAERPAVRIATVEAEGEGQLLVSGVGAPGATLRLYLNDAFVAPGATTADGKLAFSIQRGVRPGDYRVRLDDVDPVSGQVKSRAEVPFTAPAPVAPTPSAATATSATPAPSATTAAGPVRTGPGGARPADPAARGPADSAPRPAQPGGSTVVASAAPSGGLSGASASGPASPSGSTASASADPGRVVVPEVNTAIVSRGETLWRISKRTYGKGLRYTVIYGANMPQIRNPDLIYPGQIFVLPADLPSAKP